jgi:Gpi18-like mannosyltransferase
MNSSLFNDMVIVDIFVYLVLNHKYLFISSKYDVVEQISNIVRYLEIHIIIYYILVDNFISR